MSARNPGLPSIVALGEAMIEFNQARADTPEQYLRGFGGDTSNMAIAAARLVGDAGRVGYVTRVGDDAFGRMLVDLWRTEGVDTRGVVADRLRAHRRLFRDARRTAATNSRIFASARRRRG